MDYPEKYLELDDIFLKIREKENGFRGSFVINIKEVIDNTQIEDKNDLIKMLDRLKTDQLLKVKGYYEPLIARYKVNNNKITIYGCTTKNILEHKEIINKHEEKKIAGPKITIYIDKNNGIYLNSDTMKPAYKIRRNSGRLKIILKLKNRTMIMADELRNNGQSQPSLSRDIKEINKKIMYNLDLKKEFIIHHPTGGYSLNKKYFSPDFSRPSS